MVAIMAASAAPAAAQTIFSTGNGDGFCDSFDSDDEDCFFLFDEEEECFFFDEEECFFDGDGDNDFFDFADGIDQDVEQEAESGDVDQSFEVTGTGDNSNQTVSTQGVANT